MNPREVHLDWLQLCEPSGSFFSLPVLMEAFPLGLDAVDPGRRAQVIDAYQGEDAEAFLGFLLGEALEWGDSLLSELDLEDGWRYEARDVGEEVRPDKVLVGDEGQPLLMVLVVDEDQDPRERVRHARWSARPVQQAALLCRATRCPLALVTNGDLLCLVYAPADGVTTYGTWQASLFRSERVMLASFQGMLGLRRFRAVQDHETPAALLAASAENEAELTDTLGRQARLAAELLVNAFSRADQRLGGDPLEGRDPQGVYEAAVTTLMRIVFLLTAEERGLLPVDEEIYADSYAVSTMKAHLEEEDQVLPEVLERRSTAWPRLLATVAAVHGGVEHPQLRVPPYGSRLFDPARFPFLADADGAGNPIKVDDRSMLAVLRALQEVELGGEKRQITFKNLTVEQIGHVYEGLLDHSAVRADEVIVGLKGRKKGLEPEIPLSKIEAARDGGDLVQFLVDQNVTTKKGVEKALAGEVDDIILRRLREACGNDADLVDQLRPLVHLLRTDLRDLPLVFRQRSIYVTETGAKRASGTAYTTRELADEMAEHTLAPLVYRPGPAETSDPSEWELIPSEEILALKVCDPAVGSGAILVAACRYLADRLVEAWQKEGVQPDARDVPVADDPGQSHVTVHARRLVAENCCYGVDRNPMAAEMAKLSLWLVTMARDRPFSFLDHAIVAGDSLLGLTDLEQLVNYHLDPAEGARLHSGRLFNDPGAIRAAVEEARSKRQQLEAITMRGIDDAVQKQRLLEESAAATNVLLDLADSIVAAALSTAGRGRGEFEDRLRGNFDLAAQVLSGSRAAEEHLRVRQVEGLSRDLSEGETPRSPLHWPLVFPEVFQGHANDGFHAIVGNPPFMGGMKIRGALGEGVKAFLGEYWAGRGGGKADLCAYFFLLSARLASPVGMIGLLATKTISEGETRRACLDQLLEGEQWTIYRAVKSRPWPGAATVVVAQLWLSRRSWIPSRRLGRTEVRGITSYLVQQSRVAGQPKRLVENGGVAFQGSLVHGSGFILEPSEAVVLIDDDGMNADVVRPYLSGSDVTSSASCEASRWVLDFGDRTESEARRFSKCWAIAEERIYPERALKDGKKYPRMVEEWWKYWMPRKGLYSSIASLDYVLVVPRVSKSCQVVRVKNASVYADSLVVFAASDYQLMGQLSSSFHWFWVDRMSSKLGLGLRYTPTDAFQTYPFAPASTDVTNRCEEMDFRRLGVMKDRGVGITALYDLLGDAGERSADLELMRADHRALDEAVMTAYGWEDLELGHGFHETVSGQRYTIAEEVRGEVLDRLLELSHQQHAEEVAAGLHGSGRGGARRRSAGGEGQRLFEDEG